MNSSGYDNKNGGLGGGDDAGRLGLKFDNALNGNHLDPATVVHRRPSALAMRRGTNISPYRRAKTASTAASRTAPKKYDTPPSLSAQGYGDGTSVNKSPQNSFGTTSQNYSSGFQGQNPYSGYPAQQAGFGAQTNTYAQTGGSPGQNPYGGYPTGQPGFGNTNLGNSSFQGQAPYGGYPAQQAGFGAQPNSFAQTGGFGAQAGFGTQTNTFAQSGTWGAQTNLMAQTGGFGGQNRSPFASAYGSPPAIDRREGSLSDVLLASRRSSNPNASLGAGASGGEGGDSLESSGHLSPAETYAKLVEESQQERNSWRGFVAWFKGGGKYTVLSFIIVVLALSLFTLFLFHRISKNNEEVAEEPSRRLTESKADFAPKVEHSERKSKEPERSAEPSKVNKKAATEKYSGRAEALKAPSSSGSKPKGSTKSQAKAPTKAKSVKAAPAKKAQPKPAPPKEELGDDEPTYYGEEGDDSAFRMNDDDFAPSVDIEY